MMERLQKILDLQHPFFKPLWKRVATVAAIFGWGALEWSWDNPGWATGFAILGAYCAWVFFIGYQPRDPEEPKT